MTTTLAALVALGAPATANCIAHQPANAVFSPPAALQLQWDCVTAGSLYDHAKRWYILTFKATNADQRRLVAMKLRYDLVDAFGEILMTVPVVENAKLGNGDSDAAVWAFHPQVDPNSIDHVAFHVLAAKFDTGPPWTSSAALPSPGPTPAPRAGLQRFPIHWNTYDMGSVIAPSPSPSPSPTRTPR
ncbi:MAG: hypothetical protein ABI346_03270 [Candidatus Baltobacteraceae bacterium]